MKFIKGIWGYISSMTLRDILWWVVFFGMVFVLVRGCNKHREYDDLIRNTSGIKPAPKTDVLREAEEISREVDTLGRGQVVYKLSKPIIEKIEDSAKIDSIAKVANLRSNQITAITEINGTLSKENTDLKRIIKQLENGNRDTSWVYNDPFLSITGFHKNDTVFRIGNIIADASISKVDFTKKKYWFFGSNENYSTLYFNSPYARVNGLKTVSIKQKEPFWDVNLNLEGRYFHRSKEVIIGPKLDVKIGRMNLGVGYSLNPYGELGNTLWYGGEYRLY